MGSETGKVSFDFDPASGTLAFDGEEWSLRALRHFAQGLLQQLRARLDDLFSIGGLLPDAGAGPLPPLSLGTCHGWEHAGYGLTDSSVLSKVSHSAGRGY